MLIRDLWRCWVPECGGQANVADHISPVYVGMPDVEFYSESNLRASCRIHNIARGFSARLERDTGNMPERRRPLALRTSYVR